MSRVLIAGAGALISLHAGLAQTRIGGSLECASPSFHQAIPVGDRANHTMVLSQRRCQWSQPMRILGTFSGSDVLSLFTDARGDRVSDRGYDTMVMSNGDKIFMHYIGVLKNSGRTPASSEGTFALSGGTGAFLGIYGSGTWTSRSTANGKMTVRMDGQFTLPKF
jgi:hypothetical protein